MTRRIATLSASLIALCAATAAHAQDDATEEKQNATGFGEIVVTATRQATELQDTPLAVTAQTSEQLESKGITSTADIGNIVPNATFRTAQGAFGKAVTAFIRGIGQGDSNLAAEPGVAYYIDDVYYPLLFGSQFDLLDLDHVEVLRGPQGTLFGRNALAGAVNIVSKEPDFNNPSATITVTMGRYQRLDIRAGFNLPLADNFAIRVNGSTKHRVGYQDKLDFRCEMIRRGTPQLAGNFPYADGILIQAQNFNPDNCVVGHLGGDNINAVRGTALWEPVPELHISVTGDYTDDKSENQADTLVNVNNTVGASRANINAIGDYYSVAGQPPVRYDSRFVTGDPYTTFATYGDPIGTGQALPGSSFHNGNVLRGGLRYPTISPVLNYGVSAKIVYDVAQNMAITLVGGYRYVDTLFGFDVDGSPFALEQTPQQHRRGSLDRRAALHRHHRLPRLGGRPLLLSRPRLCAHHPGVAVEQPAALPEPPVRARLQGGLRQFRGQAVRRLPRHPGRPLFGRFEVRQLRQPPGCDALGRRDLPGHAGRQARRLEGGRRL